MISISISMAHTSSKYSILLPTYNERENLPIITWLIDTELTKAYASLLLHEVSLEIGVANVQTPI